MSYFSTRAFAGAILLGTLAAFAPLAQAETVITESAGTISSFSPDSLVIRSEVASAPTRYVLSRDVTYVDDAGAPVSMEVVRSGAPVTVHYVRDADRVLARRVVVHRTAVTRPATTVIEQRPAAVIEQRTAPVVIEKRAPAVVEERRVVRPATAPVVEERTVTTTTTTSSKKDD